MDDDEIDRLMGTLKAERISISQKIDELRRREAALEQTLIGLSGLRSRQPGPTAAAAASTAVDVPRGIEAIRRVLAESGVPMDTRQITEELAQRGWAPRSASPENATSTNASRAVRLIAGIKRDRGENGHYLYRYEPNQMSGTQLDDVTLDGEEVIQ